MLQRSISQLKDPGSGVAFRVARLRPPVLYISANESWQYDRVPTLPRAEVDKKLQSKEKYKPAPSLVQKTSVSRIPNSSTPALDEKWNQICALANRIFGLARAFDAPRDVSASNKREMKFLVWLPYIETQKGRCSWRFLNPSFCAMILSATEWKVTCLVLSAAFFLPTTHREKMGNGIYLCYLGAGKT